MEQAYLDALKYVLAHGVKKQDRTAVGTLSTFGIQQRYDLSKGFPAVTTKKLAWRACVGELLWFIEGSGDERRLAEITHGTREGVATIWTPNALAPYWKPHANYEGDLGRVYGVQWRKWRKFVPNNEVPGTFIETEIDQLQQLIDGIKRDPSGRRHILSSWNVSDLDAMALPPCHCFAQFYVNDGKLSCQMYQRSNDLFLGCPFNIASYSLLTHMIAQVCDLAVGEFIHVTGDAHIYLNHIEQVKEQLSRTPYTAPKLWLNPAVKNIEDFTMDGIKLEGYTSWPALKAPMAV